MSRSTVMSTDLQALLRACKASPDDDLPRLVLADWLEEQGSPRGELIRIQVERERLPRWHHQQGPLARRESELLRQNRLEWCGPLAGVTEGPEFRRGLLRIGIDSGERAASLDCPHSDWIETIQLIGLPTSQSSLETIIPDGIARIDIQNPNHRSLPLSALSRCGRLDQLVGLRLEGIDYADGEIAALGSSPYFADLTSFEIVGCDDGASRLAGLISSSKLKRLNQITIDLQQITSDGLEFVTKLDHSARCDLRISGGHLGEQGAQLLASSPLAPRLHSLSLSVTHLGTPGLLALLGAPKLVELRHLSISSERMTVGAIRALGNSPHLVNLRSLELTECQIKAPMVKALANSPLMARLERLSLFRNNLRDESVAELTNGPNLSAMKDLDLGYNHIRKDGASLLANSEITGLGRLKLGYNGLHDLGLQTLEPWLASQQLVSLDVGNTYFGEAGMSALARCSGLESLIELDVSGNYFEDGKGAIALAKAPWLDGLVHLSLFATRIGSSGLKALLNSAQLRLLTSLNLSLCKLGDSGMKMLAEWPELAGLTDLNLISNEITEEGAAALAESPYLSPFIRLELSQNELSDHVISRFRERLGTRFVFQTPHTIGLP